MDLFTEQLRLFLPRSLEEKQRLHMMGAAIDGFLGEVASRFTVNEEAAGKMFHLQQFMFKVNGMNWWNDIHKGAFAKLTAMHLGENGHLSMADLPADLRSILNLYDIGPHEWNVLRDLVYSVGDNKYLTPDRISGLPDSKIDPLLDLQNLSHTENNRLRMRDQLETKLRAFITDQVDDAVPTPGARERRLTYWNTQAGTAKGAAVRLLMHFKSFPITIWERIVKRELYGHGSNSVREFFSGDLKGNFRMIQLIAMTTIGGYVSMTIKDLVRGRTPRRLVEDGKLNSDVLLAAMQNGGGLGIYGQFLFSEYDRSYRNALNTAAGPIIGQVPEIAATATDLLKGKKTAVSAEKLIIGNTPFINLFYIRPVLDYTILWNIQEMLDPGSLMRQENNVRERNHQGFWVTPSEVQSR